MVNNNENEMTEHDIDPVDDMTDTTEIELEDAEEITTDKLKQLRTKLKESDIKNRDLHEELQRTKADFLNARKRLEDERLRDRDRLIAAHIERLLPICDSFHLAMIDKDAWEKTDDKWRKGIEGIKAQVTNLLDSYQVRSYDPTGEAFDPNRHEALSMITVPEAAQHNRILTVIQLGYERTAGDTKELIRPARVTVGEFTA